MNVEHHIGCRSEVQVLTKQRDTLRAEVEDLKAANTMLREVLEYFCIVASLLTDTKPDKDVYTIIEKELGGAIAEAWRKARTALAKWKKVEPPEPPMGSEMPG